MGADEPVLLQGADAGKVGMILVLMSVSLTVQPGVIPSLDRTPGELVAAVLVPDPVSGASKLLGVGALAELEPSRVD